LRLTVFLLKIVFGRWIRQVSPILRMPLKRATPSFTVEYRQAKQRSNSRSAKPGWANAKLVSRGLDEQTNRIAISAFKTAVVKPPAEVVAPSIPSGRILPSLVETAPVTGQSNPGSAQSRSYGGAAQAGHAKPALAGGTAARQLGEHVYPAEGLEPPIALAATLPLGQPTTSRLSAGKAATRRSEKPTRRPPEQQAKLDDAPGTFVDRSETALVNSASDLPPAGKPSLTIRKSRILGRYVFRDELGPGESWKRRIETRRERRA
jgi:hypothetical protein